LATKPNGLVVVRNITEGAKRAVESVTTEIEAELLFPLLRSGDLRRWRAEPVAHILMMQDLQQRRGISESQVQEHYPKTWAYLRRFEQQLRARAAFVRYFTRPDKRGKNQETGPFYSMFDVSVYTFAPWKVVWTRMGNKIDAAVISQQVVPQETITLIACESEAEAHFLAAVINSTPFQFAAFAYSQAGGKSFGSPHLLENIGVPAFDPNNELHGRLTSLSEAAHRLTLKLRAGQAAQKALSDVENEIGEAAAELWGLTPQELNDVQASLRELKGEPT